VILADRRAAQRAHELLHRARAGIVVPMIRQHPERRRLDQRERAHAVRIPERKEQRSNATVRHPDQVRPFHGQAIKGRTQRRHLGHERITRRERPILKPVLNRKALHIYDAMRPRKHRRHAAPPVGAEESTAQKNHRAAASENPCLRSTSRDGLCAAVAAKPATNSSSPRQAILVKLLRRIDADNSAPQHTRRCLFDHDYCRRPAKDIIEMGVVYGRAGWVLGYASRMWRCAAPRQVRSRSGG
jgi:hypothetical protein